MRARSGLTVVLGLVVVAGMSGLAGCAGDGGAQEPVAKDEGAPAVPDMPGGDAGETAEKPAGHGEANGTAVEKSQSNKAAAKKQKKGAVAMAGSMTVVPELLNVRSGPGMSHEPVRKLKKGDKVDVSGCKAGWCQIGDKEFVGQKFLAP